MTHTNGWGPWRIDTKACVLHIDQPSYDIELTQCTSKEVILGWISHMADKTWMDDALLAGLTRAMNDLFHPHWSSGSKRTAAGIRAAIAYMQAEGELDPYIRPIAEESS